MKIPAENIREVDKLTITVITDNYYDAVRPDSAIGTRFRATLNNSIHAEHGLSYYIETQINGIPSSCMFDFGLDPVGVSNNMRLLDIDIGKANALGLSHGHFDHFGGLVEILRQNCTKIKQGIPLYVGKEAFERRFSHRPGAHKPQDIGQLNKDEIEGLGVVKIVEIDKPTEIIPGCYLTGNIEKVTGYEVISPSLLIERNGKHVQDDFGGEQAIAVKVAGRGLVVLSGCAHTGIVNTVKYAQKVMGTDKICAVIGGFHLINATAEIIQRTVSDISAIKPEYIVPTHCTGFEAITAFLNKMPEQFILNTAGTKYVIKSK